MPAYFGTSFWFLLLSTMSRNVYMSTQDTACIFKFCVLFFRRPKHPSYNIDLNLMQSKSCKTNRRMKYSALGEVLYKDMIWIQSQLETVISQNVSHGIILPICLMSAKILSLFRPEYVQKTVHNFAEQVDSW